MSTEAPRRHPVKAPAETRHLKVTLLGVEPRVRRWIGVRADDTLFDLYLTLIGAMGWGDSHLHLFEVGDETYAPPYPDIEPLGVDERTLTVAGALPDIGSKIVWLYDMGDNWDHEIELTEIGEAQSDITYPNVEGGDRACPPEDCGGSYGYMEILRTLADPEYENLEYVEREELLGWIPFDFEPDHFDLREAQEYVNEILRLDYWRPILNALS